jgi:hypothetical protein
MEATSVRRALVLRLWLYLLLVLFAFVGGSGFPLAAAIGEACAQSCPDDDERGQCAPDCADCSCCVHTRTVMLAPPAVLLPSRSGPVLIEHEEQAPPAVDVGDILHVPILALG